VSARGIVALTLACPNACVFCAQVGLGARSPRSEQDVRSALRALRSSCDRVTFVGGEPGLVAALEEHVGAARGEGFVRIGVQTNGAGLVDVARLRALASAGLTDVHLSLLGADAATHDYHTGTPQSFERVMASLAAARSARLDVAASTVLTRSNFRTLDALAQRLVACGATSWCVSVPIVAGRAEANFDRVVPRLGLALPFALRALSSARARGVAAFVSGAPLCLLGPHGAHAIGEERRAFAPACEGCVAREQCPGVDAAYLERFDGDELGPRPTLARPSTLASSRALSEMFVGPGERAPARGRAAASAPTSLRRALPTLGRGQPATDEVGRGERRTGAALRELFPGLFEEREPGSDDDAGR
jgi:hypothetical protein